MRAIGGLGSVKDVLAEDHFIGEKIRERKQRVVISNYLVNNVNEYWGLRKFINRHVRWGKMRWKIGGIRYVSELAINPVFISILPVFLYGLTWETLSLFIIACAVKMSGDFYLGRRIGTRLPPLSYLLSPVKDLLIGLIWFVPFIDDTVIWRGNRYPIGKNSVLFPCQVKGIWAWPTEWRMPSGRGWLRHSRDAGRLFHPCPIILIIREKALVIFGHQR